MQDQSGSNDKQTIANSGLFDAKWYAQQYLASRPHQVDPLDHFCELGWKKGYKPNAYFDSAWYVFTYAKELGANGNPLVHYVSQGERENAWPSPHFDPEWYRDWYSLGENESPLRHFLLERFNGNVSPLPSFDVSLHVAAHPAVLTQKLDPYLHHLNWMANIQPCLTTFAAISSHMVSVPTWDSLWALMAEGAPDTAAVRTKQLPTEGVIAAIKCLVHWLPFDADWYAKTYPDVAQAVADGVFDSAHAHFIDHGYFEGRLPRPL